MSDPWKDAWEHLKKFLTDEVGSKSGYFKYEQYLKGIEKVRDWMCDKEQEMVEDGLIEGSETDAK